MARRVSADNQAPVVEAMALLLLAFVCLAVAARMLVKLYILRKVTADDWLLLAGWVFSIAQSVTITLAAINGFGRRQDSLSPAQLEVVEKTLYSSQLLYLPAIGLAKLSVASYLYAISPVRWHRRMILAACALIVPWLLSGELVWAFQCSVPRTWAIFSGKCIDLVAFARSMAVMNLVTELVLIVVPVLIVTSTQMRWKKMFKTITIFCSRFLVVGAAACQLAFASQLGDRTNGTLTSWPYVLTTQVTQAACLIATCSLYTRSFLDAVQSGMISVDDVRRRGEDPAAYNAEARSKGSNERKHSTPNALRPTNPRPSVIPADAPSNGVQPDSMSPAQWREMAL